MMFFKNAQIYLFLDFLWWGLLFGFVHILCKLVVKATRKNVYITNFVSFCFWLAFGMVYSIFSISHFNYSVCWFGLAGMFFGFVLVKISVDFLFTNFIRLLYNKFTRKILRKS